MGGEFHSVLETATGVGCGERIAKIKHCHSFTGRGFIYWLFDLCMMTILVHQSRSLNFLCTHRSKSPTIEQVAAFRGRHIATIDQCFGRPWARHSCPRPQLENRS